VERSVTHTFLIDDQSVTSRNSVKGTRVPSISSFIFSFSFAGDSSDEPILTTTTSTLPFEIPYLRIASVIFRIDQRLQDILKAKRTTYVMGRIKIIQDLRVYSFRAKLALRFCKDSLRDRSLYVQLASNLMKWQMF
jgi:hypothetical protein